MIMVGIVLVFAVFGMALWIYCDRISERSGASLRHRRWLAVYTFAWVVGSLAIVLTALVKSGLSILGS